MEVVKKVGPITLCMENGKFYLVHCKTRKSQPFDTDKQAWITLRSHGIHWERI